MRVRSMLRNQSFASNTNLEQPRIVEILPCSFEKSTTSTFLLKINSMREELKRQLLTLIASILKVLTVFDAQNKALVLAAFKKFYRNNTVGYIPAY